MKKALTITIIIIILGSIFLYIRNKNTPNTDGGTNSSFKDFFNFGSKEAPLVDTNGNENTSDFTTDETDPSNPDTSGENGSNSNGNTTGNSTFGNSSPFTPLSLGGGTVGNGGDTNGGGGLNGGSVGGGGTVGSGGGVGNGGGGSGGGGNGGGGGGSGGGVTQCTSDDTVINFTPGELARLRDLEARFYNLAPTLRTDRDVQAESSNYSSYKLLNQKYGELIAYCENKSPLLPSEINRRVSTPLYTDSSANAYFSNGPDADGVIDMQNTTPKLKEIEKFFRINIW